ncbi:P-loop NTPase fold protein [Yersinia bercovieri]|uniref:P-loop NTPase fold protein n=1 Tax=Yersinia bercovieri TaxID=634 RepID=UPI0005E3EB80|nr:P-loop NTPase fold protein [Yersinia bercovieri]CNI27919.1 Predicted P-loop ATPase [Yersinia bercovieri]
MNLKLQTATPSDNDIFEGKSHETVAIKMAEVIKSTDISIIGLEGELGTGKSTIIRFLMDKLEGDFHFITFDAERYHYGSTKKSLIEIIYKGMSEVKGINNPELQIHKDKALGNIVEYEKKINSRISWWTISFILCTLLSVQMIRYFLVDINQYLNPIDPLKPLSIWILLIEALGLISPVLVLLILVGIRKYQKQRGTLTDACISIGDLFKRNSTDTISEKWLVSREIGTIELTEALEGFTKKETISEDCRFILIIDNLDRISGDKVKELWSDMELIAGVTHEQFRVVVPYSARQVAKSLAVEGHSGQEFIAKRIPVSFSVPPLISAGWQSAFSVLWKETVSEVDDISCHETAQLLDRWRPAEYPQITPRLMKKMVNDIHILALTVPGGEPYRHILIALYILAVRYGGLNIRNLLRVPTESDADNNNVMSQDPVLDDKLKATVKQLAKIFSNETDRWSEYLMSVHYQTEIALARSELIDTPLINAITTRNKDKLQQLISLWGFQTAWQRCTDRFAISDWLVIAADLPEEILKSVTPELRQGALIMDAQYAHHSRENYRGELSSAIKKLLHEGYISQSGFMKRQRNFIINDLDEAQGNINNVGEKINELLQDANIYSSIFGSNLIDEMKYHIHGEFYVKSLMRNASIFESLNINDITLSDEGIEEMLRCHLEDTEHGDIFMPEVARHIRLFTDAVGRIIDNAAKNLPASVSESLQKLNQGIELTDCVSFRKIVFNSEWYTTNLISYYAHQIHIMADYPIEFAAQKMAHMVAINTYTEIPSYIEYADNNEFAKILSDYFIYFKNFDIVISSIKREDIAPIVISAIKILFSTNKINRMNPISYGKVHYPLLKQHAPELDFMKTIVNRQDWIVNNLKMLDFLGLNSVFVNDVIESPEMDGLASKFIELTKSIFISTETVHKSFIKIESNIKIILEHMNNGKIYNHIADLRAFSNWYRTSPLEQVGNAVNAHMLWTVLDEDQKVEIIKELTDIIYERDTAIERRVALLHDFSEEIYFAESEDTKERRAIAALFAASKDDEILKSWLDKQSFHFNKWNAGDSDTVTRYILEHQDDFPIICDKSIFIKNRIQK